ncbi:HlyD family secretion protein [Pseudomonas sp. 10S4]|uniref:HlyD family efflux transporter periplasmic adaptor subunit n=1 Tax=Pseudomonas sp. 10S4 TaxID=3048583 RepID=UPI002AC9360E|nr:HlyD family efflux transporter periplasmic adaptor subunit [Pseudomonas sp. 10S4]WPX17463.1 HlyD family secretion protein [Pseudomonas sp. 10S4]
MQELAVHTIGGVVTPAQALLVIVPDDAGLEIEAQILNRDIGFVRPGQDAEIKLDAFPYTHYGTIPGKVMSISQDAVKDDKLGLVYPARIQLGAHVIVADGKDVQLEPGMSSSVEIKTEQRRIIEYLLTPLLKYQSEALRER